MTTRSSVRHGAVLSASLLLAAGCAKSSPSVSAGPTAPFNGFAAFSIAPPSPDPRVGLKAGMHDAGEAIWNMKLLGHAQSPPGFETNTNSDLAFTGTTVLQGNYNGFVAWDVSNPANPVVKVANLCPSSQDDISVYGNLVFLSAESGANRLDCSAQGGRGSVSGGDAGRILGLRIYDISDINKPKYIANVQTCRGSHTHTLVEDPKDKENVYIYISGTSSVRSDLAGCIADQRDPNTASFRLEIIKVPLKAPEKSAIVSISRIFQDPKTGAYNGVQRIPAHGASPADAGRGGRGGAAQAPPPDPRADSIAAAIRAMVSQRLKPLTPRSTKADTAAYIKTSDSLTAAGYYVAPLPGSPRAAGGASANLGGLNQCHDITVYPWAGLAGGACGGMGLLLDISDPTRPVRIDAVGDTNFSYWHSATFSNDGKKILFSDEWGGGGAAYCRAGDPKEWGGNAIFTIENRKMHFKSYYKIPAAQTAQENCVAHNGSLIPVPGRDILVQAFYQGGLTVFDWTDPSHPKEIAFFDRGPYFADRLASGGYWSVYWYNGRIYGSEEKRGLDIFELSPSPALSQNEIDAAKLVHWDQLNVQGQPHYTWPAHIAVVRSYLDQLVRYRGIAPARSSALDGALTRAMAQTGGDRKAALNAIAKELDGDAKSAADGERVKLMAAAVRDLAGATK